MARVDIFNFHDLNFQRTRILFDGLSRKYEFTADEAEVVQDQQIVLGISLRRYLITPEDRLKASLRMIRYRRSQLKYWQQRQITEAV